LFSKSWVERGWRKRREEEEEEPQVEGVICDPQ